MLTPSEGGERTGPRTGGPGLAARSPLGVVRNYRCARSAVYPSHECCMRPCMSMSGFGTSAVGSGFAAACKSMESVIGLGRSRYFRVFPSLVRSRLQQTACEAQTQACRPAGPVYAFYYNSSIRVSSPLRSLRMNWPPCAFCCSTKLSIDIARRTTSVMPISSRSETARNNSYCSSVTSRR